MPNRHRKNDKGVSVGIQIPSPKSSRPREITSVRSRVVTVYLIILSATAVAWIWAVCAYSAYPLLLGTAFLAYTFGLRHAVDADHIAAIDNVTRKLMQDGKRPVDVGFFFSLGHSLVVILASAVVALTAGALKEKFASLQAVGGIISTSVSAGFLLTLAVLNIIVFLGVYKTFQRVKKTRVYADEDMNMLMAQGGILSRICRPLFGMVRHSWQMLPIGFLFGLGFDTSTEVAVLGISAAEGAKGVSMWSIMVFPALFTVGMSLIDTSDGVLMLNAYQWAFVTPMRKLYYNMTITAVSVVVALLIGGIEALGLLGGQLSLSGSFWTVIASLNDHFNALGFVIIGIFAVAWAGSVLIYRFKRYDEIAVKIETT
jgi:high-affinity nickel-transport protein